MFDIPPEYLLLKCKVEASVRQDMHTFETYALETYGKACTLDIVMTGILRTFLAGSTREMRQYREWLDTRDTSEQEASAQEPPKAPSTARANAAKKDGPSQGTAKKPPERVLAEAKRSVEVSEESASA